MEGLQTKKSQLIGISIITVIMVGVIAYILRKESPQTIIETLLKVKLTYLIFAILLMIFYILCEGINIRITMVALKKKTTLLKCLGYGFVGFYFSSITPSSSGGQPAQVYFMKRDGISMTSSSLSLMVLLFAHQFVIIVLGVLGFLVMPDVVSSFHAGLNLLLVYGFISNALILIGILMLIFSPKMLFNIINSVALFLYKIKVVKNREKLKNRIDRALVEYERGAIYMKENPKVLLQVTLVTFLQIVAMFAIPVLIYKGFGLNKYNPIDIVLMQAILNIAVSSLPLPGSVGASESAFINMFEKFFGSLVIPGMLLTRIANFYVVLILSGVISLYMYIKKERHIAYEE